MPAGEKQITTPEISKLAIREVRKWEAGERDRLICPVCRVEGIVIADKSVRPHMLWHFLTCKSCGLDEAIATPMIPG